MNIRFGDVIPDSYEWTTIEQKNIISLDEIEYSEYYEVIFQNQINPDDYYLDTVAIRAYKK